MNFSASQGVRNLLKRANEKSSYVGEKFFFLGDLQQRCTAMEIAGRLGLTTNVEGGLPFVTSKEAQQKVIQYLIDRQIDGWRHYVTNKEYCKIVGKYLFNGMCLKHYDKIKEIADKLSITLYTEERSRVLYTTSEESFNTIIEKLKQDYGIVIDDQ